MKKYRPINCYPLLGTRWVVKGKSRTLMIKVRMDGPQSKRWVTWQRWWWESNRGPVPAGKRVVFLDGNPENQSPENIECVTGGDVFVIAGEKDPSMFDRNREACRQGTIEMNRRRGIERRKKTYLPTQWYAVFIDRKQILNIPKRSRSGLMRLFGSSVPRNGIIPLEKLPFVPTRGRDISKESHPGFRRINKVPAAARQAVIDLRINQYPIVIPNPSGKCQCGCGGETPKADANYPDVSLGQHRRFIDGHYYDLRHRTSAEGARLRARALQIAQLAATSCTEFRSDELIGPAFEAALAALRSTRRIPQAEAAAREACKRYFTSQRSYGHVSVDYLVSKGFEPASHDA